MNQGTIETIVGFLVIVIAATFFSFAYKISHSSVAGDGYTITASFQDIEGLSEGNEVKLSGIKIGYIDRLILEDDSYMAVAYLKIHNNVEIPSDSRAAVSTSGLFGSKYIRIIPGAETDHLQNHGKIKFTQPALNIEDLINKLVYSITNK